MVKNMIPIRVNLVFVFIAVTLIFSLCIWTETNASVDLANKITVTYLSDDHNKLIVIFDVANDSVEVTLPDGRQVNLPRGISASGARYTDKRETFWEHHGEGSYWVGDKLIFRGKAKE